jgi:hypothetical protein
MEKTNVEINATKAVVYEKLKFSEVFTNIFFPIENTYLSFLLSSEYLFLAFCQKNLGDYLFSVHKIPFNHY